MKKILVLNFFPAFVPPKSGGELRYFNFYRHLSADHDVTLLSPTYSHHQEEVIRHHDHFREYRVPKEPIHDRLHALVDQDQICSECSALVCALSARYPNRYHRLYLKLQPQADVIIHDFPYMLEYDLFFGLDGKPRIYNSHNYESNLVAQLWTGPHADKYQRYIRCLEGRLVRHCDAVFAVSAEERRAMANAFDVAESAIGLAPNGITPEDYPRRRIPTSGAGKLQACFIGTRHPPNIEAARFLVDEVAPLCPRLAFVIAGTCCEGLEGGQPPNVRILGPISDEDKRRLFDTSLVALNPMFSGAGTNLKTLEYLAAGLPLVATRVGVRGLDLKPDQHFIPAERFEFAQVLNQIIEDPALLEGVAEIGRQWVLEHCAWEKIVKGFAASLSAIEPRQAEPVLVLNDFPVRNQHFGGATRIRCLYKELSKQRPVVLITLNNEGILERFDHGPGFAELSFPKTKEHLRDENRINADSDISVNDIVASRHCRGNDLLREALDAALDFAGALVLSHPYLAPLIDGRPPVPIIHESHNFEYHLKQQLLANHPAAEELLAQVRSVEGTAVKISSLVVSVSAEDASRLASYYELSKDVEVIENGVDLNTIQGTHLDLEKARRVFQGRSAVAFIGSAHRPNVAALEYLVCALASAFPQVYFLVIGTVCAALCRTIPENVLFFHQVDETMKTALLKMATVAVNPISSGSGSNLKLADYFAHGLPTVTTEFGARGYAITSGQQALIGALAEFPALLGKLLEDPELRRHLARQALDYVSRHHAWAQLADKYHAVLQRTIFARRRPRLLVVTHRFTLPPLGGAELYLWQVLQHLDAKSSFQIDIVAPAIQQLDNRMHFATTGTAAEAPAFEMISSHMSVQRFPLALPTDRDAAPVCRALHHLWYEESIRLSLDHADRYDRPLLMGGWNYPERQEDGSVRIWTSERALIWVQGLDSVRIAGFTSGKRSVSCRLDGTQAGQKKWRGTDSWTVSTSGRDVLEILVENARCQGSDPRLLGILVESIQGRVGSRWQPLDLGSTYRDHLKQCHLESYLRALRAVALARDPAFDEQFLRVRGPAAEGLEQWISEHLAEYDVVLGHGAPFQPLVIVARQAAAAGKPYALLPHFHFDDEFYHWQSFYQAMQGAHCVFAFPEMALPLFYQPLNIRTRSLPGGAVDPEEFHHDHRPALHRIYQPAAPFFLVLGRKSGSKNYPWAIDAIREIRRQGVACELLLIGPDDDHRPLPPDCTYLRRQPREVVLGAIQDCVALINMSASESFGMVLLEAWMCRKPVIVNRDCRAFAELVKPGENGILSDRTGLSEQLRTLLARPDLARDLGEKGLQTVGENYTWQRIADTIQRDLLQLVSTSVGVASPDNGAERDSPTPRSF